MLAVSLEQFEGPLDLLLRLIEEEKLDITEVSLARVADQYLSRLTQFSEEHRLDELSDFIVIAAKLLLIKSRALVPLLAPEEEEEVTELQRQLKMYRAFIDAGKKIDALFRRHQVAYPRRAPLSHDSEFVAPASITAEVLRDTFAKILRAIELPREKPREIIFASRISIKEKIDQIIALLSTRSMFRFHDVLHDASNKADVVVSFMALLEIAKQRTIAVSQEKLFDDIVISRATDTVTQDTRGQTLIEVITALAVLAVGLVGVLSLATSNVRNQGIGLSRLFANNLARDGIEFARNTRDTNWLSGKQWHTGLVNTESCAVIDSPRSVAFDFIPCPASGDLYNESYRIYRVPVEEKEGSAKVLQFDEHHQMGSAQTIEGTPTAFYRTVQLDLICLTATKDAETLDGCTSADAIGMRITSEVAWKQSGRDQLVRLRENLYNWR